MILDLSEAISLVENIPGEVVKTFGGDQTTDLWASDSKFLFDQYHRRYIFVGNWISRFHAGITDDFPTVLRDSEVKFATLIAELSLARLRMILKVEEYSEDPLRAWVTIETLLFVQAIQDNNLAEAWGLFEIKTKPLMIGKSGVLSLERKRQDPASKDAILSGLDECKFLGFIAEFNSIVAKAASRSADFRQKYYHPYQKAWSALRTYAEKSQTSQAAYFKDGEIIYSSKGKPLKPTRRGNRLGDKYYKD